MFKVNYMEIKQIAAGIFVLFLCFAIPIIAYKKGKFNGLITTLLIPGLIILDSILANISDSLFDSDILEIIYIFALIYVFNRQTGFLNDAKDKNKNITSSNEKSE